VTEQRRLRVPNLATFFRRSPLMSLSPHKRTDAFQCFCRDRNLWAIGCRKLPAYMRPASRSQCDTFLDLPKPCVRSACSVPLNLLRCAVGVPPSMRCIGNHTAGEVWSLPAIICSRSSRPVLVFHSQAQHRNDVSSACSFCPSRDVQCSH